MRPWQGHHEHLWLLAVPPLGRGIRERSLQGFVVWQIKGSGLTQPALTISSYLFPQLIGLSLLNQMWWPSTLSSFKGIPGPKYGLKGGIALPCSGAERTVS